MRASVCVLALALAPTAAFMASPVAQRPVALRRAVEEEQSPVEEPAPVEEEPVYTPPPAFSASDLVGATAPFGFFDPLGISGSVSEKRVMYFREAELKHGRVAMLAALGFLVAEKFHPLFGGNINVPSYVAFQETPLQTFWPVVVLYIGVIEIFSVFTFENPFEGNLWTINSSHKPGDFDFDPAGLKPTDAKEYEELQCKELNNGRLAMIAIAGMVGQELATGSYLF